jgi:hypothetical protein
LRPKLRNHRGDFEAQIINPHTSVLRPKLENPTPPWFYGSTKKHNTNFEAKPGETIATIFEGKLKKTVATGFEAKTEKTVSGVLRPNHWQTVAIGFEDQTDEKPFEWFWGQNTHKLSQCFWGQTNRRPWFWGWTKKHMLLISMCTVQTAHSVT